MFILMLFILTVVCMFILIYTILIEAHADLPEWMIVSPLTAVYIELFTAIMYLVGYGALTIFLK